LIDVVLVVLTSCKFQIPSDHIVVYYQIKLYSSEISIERRLFHI
jgi:hypothetical protein